MSSGLTVTVSLNPLNESFTYDTHGQSFSFIRANGISDSIFFFLPLGRAGYDRSEVFYTTQSSLKTRVFRMMSCKADLLFLRIHKSWSQCASELHVLQFFRSSEEY